MSNDAIKTAARAHTVYRLADGTRVPGVTTVTGQLAKPQLVRWANRLGLEGVDCGKYTDESAAVGTLAHAMMIAHLGGEAVDGRDYSPAQTDLAENALISFYEWLGRHRLQPVLRETPLVSESLRYGGTPDCYGILDGQPTLLDFKTGKAVYAENFVQLAGYRRLLEERGYPVRACMVLRLGRDEDEGFEARSVPDTAKYYEVFMKLLDVYYLKKDLKWN